MSTERAADEIRQRETFREQLMRVQQMAEEDGEDEIWDLSPNDTAALRAVLAELSALRTRLREMEAGQGWPVDSIECGWCDGKGWLAPDDPAFTVGAEPEGA